MTNPLETHAGTLLDAAISAGADAADAVLIQANSNSIEIRNGALEEATRSEDIDLGLRVMIGKQQAIVSSSSLNPDALRQMAERAVAMAAEAPEDPHIGLAEPDQLARDWDISSFELHDPSHEPSAAELQSLAQETEAAALNVAGVTQSNGATAAFGTQDIFLAATNGFSGGYARTTHVLSCTAICGEGTNMERDYDHDMRIFRSDMRDAAEIGRIAGERAVARHGSRKPPTGAFPVMYDERVASSLVGHLIGAINGAAIARGSSWLLDALGTQVLPHGMDLVEDPLRPRIGGSRPFDGEGLPTRRKALVENGVLTGWVLDLATARKLGMESSANAARGTSSGPSPSVTNLSLTQGTKSQAELLKDMGTGLLITSMIGSSINGTTGDYSRGASGYWVDNGELAYPVNECTVAGNLRDMLLTLVPANDARLHLSRVVPSMLVDGLTIAGE